MLAARSPDSHRRGGSCLTDLLEAPPDLRVVPCDDRRARSGVRLQHVVCAVHPLEVVHHGEGPLELELLVEVHRVRGEHDVAAALLTTVTCWPGE